MRSMQQFDPETATTPDRFAGSVALVTGAAQGQGRSHALRLAREGADLVVLDRPDERSQELLAETASAVSALGRRVFAGGADIADGEALASVVRRAEAELGTVDVAVANAAITQRKAALDVTTDEWDRMVGINLGGAWNTVRAVLPSMREAGRGTIVMIGSIASVKAMPGLAHYAAAKHGVAGLITSLAAEFGPDGIRVNGVLPTRVLTPMLQAPATLKGFRPDLDEPTLDDVRELLSATHPLRVPWVESGDITAAVCWLASDEARFVTGTLLPVDAGALLA
jgi:NAD(P)-dependent dehydrogenase (short-subunit alcohol dehydrogenase family)